jgi:hypothetical protein
MPVEFGTMLLNEKLSTVKDKDLCVPETDDGNRPSAAGKTDKPPLRRAAYIFER